MDPEILFEDNHIIVVNKKSSELVQSDHTGDESLDVRIKQYLKHKYNKPGNIFLGVVHRIDRPVSGIVVFAKTSKALTRMNNIFRERDVRKVYWAIVKSYPTEESATLNHFLIRNRKQNKSYAYDHQKPGSKKATLSYQLKAKSKSYYFLQVELFTGRHHQIRSQLSKIGCPIKGDLKYGSKRSNPDGSICLHARQLEFTHPVKQTNIKIISNPPEDVLWDEFTSVMKE